MESLFEHRIEELVCAAQVRIEQVCNVPKIQTYHVSAYVSVVMSTWNSFSGKAADKVSDSLRAQVREVQAGGCWISSAESPTLQTWAHRHPCLTTFDLLMLPKQAPLLSAAP